MLRSVTTRYGAIEGIVSGDPRITVFKGVPFAVPPIGELRWKAPQPVEPWEGVYKADHFAPIAMQSPYKNDMTDFYMKEIHPCGSELKMSEDCLYLNIWSPAETKDDKLPVFFWIHGGGYTGGYSYEMEFDGERIARKGCIVVTIAYRMGGLGFFAHAELEFESPGCSQGNFGFLDQVAALKWVRENIDVFGGDPDRIVICGQSAGAGSVTALICSPLTAGMISGAILMSGGGFNRTGENGCSLERAQEESSLLFNRLGVLSLEEARQLPAESIINAMSEVRAAGGGYSYRVYPVVDGVFLKENPVETIMNDRLPDIPIMCGFCHDEGFSFFQRKIPRSVKAFEAEIREEYGEKAEEFLRLADVKSPEDIERLYRSETFHPFLLTHGCFASVLERQNRKVYMYMFDHDIPGDSAGSYHGSDLWFVFDSLNRCWRPFEGRHYDLARQVSSYIVNFTRNGDPNGLDSNQKSLPVWESYSGDRESIQVFRDIPIGSMLPSDALLRFRQKHFLDVIRQRGGMTV